MRRIDHRFLWFVMAGVAIVTFGVAAMLISIFEKRQEALTPFVRLVEVNETTTDPKPWGVNWPHQYDSYLKTADSTPTQFGGSSAMPESKLDADPWLRRLYAGYAFSLDYREARGHAYMLYDQTVTERVTKRKQSGACLHCHASVIPTYRRIGMELAGEEVDEQTLANDLNMEAVLAGFEHVSMQPYQDVLAELTKTPDGSLESGPDDVSERHAKIGLSTAHPVSCIDCHDPKTMALRVTRPGFIQGIAALAAGDAAVPHLPSIETWRKQGGKGTFDANALASRQEMRSFVCGQCHVEYYCGNRMTLTYPWNNGLKAEDLEQTWAETLFPDGEPFYDYKHGETGALTYKAQHPEFELWSQGIHASAGVSCADCHMPYERKGAMKVSSHWVRSPMLSINRSCQTCHKVSESELRTRVATIQGRTRHLVDRAANAMTDMLDAILEARASGVNEESLLPVLALQTKAMWRLDFISSENSRGFHAGQEAARILGEAIDYSRQAQAAAITLRAPKAPAISVDKNQVQGVSELKPK